MRRHTRRVYNLCYRFTGNGAAAEDLSQEVFLRVYKTLGSYQPVYGAFPTWLTSVTRNLLVDHYRRTRRDRITDSIDDAMPQVEEKHSPVRSPDKVLQATELSEQLQRGPRSTVARAARGCDLAGFAGARLQRNSHGPAGARGNGEIQNQPRPHRAGARSSRNGSASGVGRMDGDELELHNNGRAAHRLPRWRAYAGGSGGILRAHSGLRCVRQDGGAR